MATDEVTGRLDRQPTTRPPAHILQYLVETRIIDDEATVVASSLSGGVSNDVLAITAPGVDVVVKQALPKLRVDAEWFASPARIITEARALQTAGAILPDNVPPVLAFDEVRHLMVIGRAPRTSYEWKSDLMAGIVDHAIATKLGEVLARWHLATAYDAALADSFDDPEAFIELRVDPFYRWVGTQHAAVRGTVDAVVDRMLTTKTCLVHGDFSPKNVLIGSANPWVIDWEVAHIGDPTFDLAFPITHLLCKALYRPESRPQYRRTGESFLGAYTRAVKDSIAVADEEYLTLQIACLLLARIDGKSPVPYLDDTARSRGRTVALDVLTSVRPRLENLWTLG